MGWKLSKQTSYWSKTGFFFSVKNHNTFWSQNIVIPSQSNAQKYHNKGHEQALCLHQNDWDMVQWFNDILETKFQI